MLEFKAEMLAVSTPNMMVMLGASFFEYVISNVMYGNFLKCFLIKNILK